MTGVSRIYGMANAEPPTGSEAERRNREVFAKAWQSMGLIIVRPEDITDDWTRQAFINEAEKQHGKRETR